MATILLVEDNPQNMKLATLVLMDINLPGIDGFEATRRLKADALSAGIKVLALTAYAMPGDEARILAAGFDGYLSKPIHHAELRRLVEAALQAPP